MAALSSRSSSVVALVAFIFFGRTTMLPIRCVAASKQSSAEATLHRYLQESADVDDDGKFYVQGWRWHTMSLVREAGQLQQLAHKTAQQLAHHDPHQSSDAQDAALAAVDQLKLAADYVIGFNMKGLHNIEKDLFFPWVRERTCEAVKMSGVCRAIETVMEQLESDRQKLEAVGALLVSVIVVVYVVTVCLAVILN